MSISLFYISNDASYVYRERKQQTLGIFSVILIIYYSFNFIICYL